MERSNPKSTSSDVNLLDLHVHHPESEQFIKQEFDKNYNSYEKESFEECGAKQFKYFIKKNKIIEPNIGEYKKLWTSEDNLNAWISRKSSSDESNIKDVYPLLETKNLIKEEIEQCAVVTNDVPLEYNSPNQLKVDKSIESGVKDFVDENKIVWFKEEFSKPSFPSHFMDDKDEVFGKEQINFEDENCNFFGCYENCHESSKHSSHMNCAHQKKNFKCHLCDYISSRKFVLKVHINAVHLKLKKYKCKMCNFGASTQGNLTQHINSVHLKLRKFKCDSCDFRSALKASLNIHIQSVHLKMKNFECHFCDFNSSRKADLQMHIDSIHLKVKNHKCDLCGLKLASKRYLREHVNFVHLKLKTFKCEVCNSNYSTKGNLKRHNCS